MTLLVYCSVDVGGFPFLFADILNRGGVPTYFVCTSREGGHDSSSFHSVNTNVPWNLSREISSPFLTRAMRARRLRRLVDSHGITGCFATGTGIQPLADAGVPYLYWSFGNDLDACRWPELKLSLSEPKRSAREVARLVYSIPRVIRARRVFRGSDAVMISPFQYEAFRSTIGPEKRLFWFPHVLPQEPLATLLERKAEEGARLRRELGASRLFFSSTRQYWSQEKLRIADDKGNDVMIRGFASFRRRESGRGSKLLLIDKGPSVGASQRLANELGVGNDLVWRPEVPRSELTRFYLGSDVCFGQFGTPVLSFATLEPMAYATPVVSYVEASTPPQVPYFPEQPELCNSKDPEVIGDFLDRLCSDSALLTDKGRRSWEWIHRWCTEDGFVQAILTALAGGRSPHEKSDNSDGPRSNQANERVET